MSVVREPARYRWLNRDGTWAGFHRRGLELRADGSLALTPLPLLSGPAPDALVALGAPDGPAGVVALPERGALFTDPARERLMLVDACDGRERPAPCLGGAGSAPGQLRTPRGLAYHPRRDALLVADSGNRRIQVLDRADLQVGEIWGAGAVRFDDPRSLACAPAGDVYVVDAGRRRVERLDELGRPRGDFWAALAGDEAIEPIAVAVAPAADGLRVLVLDAGGTVHVAAADGRRLARWATGAARPMGLACDGTTVLAGDNATRRVLAFALDGTPAGAAPGYHGPVAAVAYDGRGGVLVLPGGDLGPLRLDARGGAGARGVLWGGPFRTPSPEPVQQHLLRARVALPTAGAHLQLRVSVQRAGAPAPPVHADAADPFADAAWRRLPLASDAVETLVPATADDAVWLGILFTSEGIATPVLEQVRVDFDHDSYLRHLPGLYRRDTASADALARWLTVFESAFDGVGEGIESLPRLLDPAAAPAAWLGWLADRMAVDLPEQWDEPRRRAAIAAAFAAQARRGTPASLAAELRDRTGIAAVIEEPIRQTGWWALAEGGAGEAQAAVSVLGATTVLAAAEAAGAVVGSTAVLDGSYLSPQDRYATALFGEVAHRFTVRVYRGRAYSEEAVAAARALLDRERPAHTASHICVIEPRLRVGVQARVGVDAVVGGGPAEPVALDDDGAPGGLVLGGPPPGRLGTTTRLGRTHLTDG